VLFIVIYPLIPKNKVGFLRWIAGTLIGVVFYVGLAYGLSRPLCRRFGAISTTALLVFVFFIFSPFILKILVGHKIEGKLWKWSAFSGGGALLFAFFAYLNPTGFCKL
jgi:hypothetical protein